MGYNSNTQLPILTLFTEESEKNQALLEKGLSSPSVVKSNDTTVRELFTQCAVPATLMIINPFQIFSRVHATLKINVTDVVFHSSFLNGKKYTDLSLTTDSKYISENLSMGELEYDEDVEGGSWFTYLTVTGPVLNEFPDWPQSTETPEVESNHVRCPILLAF